MTGYRLTFGKEYEFSEDFWTHSGPHKSHDGSGPSELSIPPFESFFEAIYFESLLYKIYGRLLTDYYTSGDYQEKGNHFHFRVRDREFYYLYIWSGFTSELFRKLLTLHNGFRNQLRYWCNYIAEYLEKSEFYHYSGRDYRAVTPNRNRKETLTVEVRRSEGVIALDVCWLLVTLATFSAVRDLKEELEEILSCLSVTRPKSDIEVSVTLLRPVSPGNRKTDEAMKKILKNLAEKFEVNIRLRAEGDLYRVLPEPPEIRPFARKAFEMAKERKIPFLNERQHKEAELILMQLVKYCVENYDRWDLWYFLRKTVEINLPKQDKREIKEKLMSILLE